MRIAVEVVRLQPDRLQDRQRLVAPLGRRADGVDHKRFHDLSADRDAPVERRQGILVDHLHDTAQRAPACRSCLGQGVALEPDFARGQRQKTQHQPGSRGLAAARFAHQTQGTAGLQGEGTPSTARKVAGWPNRRLPRGTL